MVTYSRAPHAPQSATPDSNPVDPWGIGKNTEPVYITTQRWGPKRFGNGHVDNGGIYQAFYYVGQIPADAVGVIYSRSSLLRCPSDKRSLNSLAIEGT